MIIIIGAGLSGLLTAYRLKQVGIAFKILEARPRVGGRINTVCGTNDTPVEMGATWFNHQHQHLISLLEEFEIDYFKQYADRSVFYQPSPTSPIQSVQIPSQPSSYRISGGTSHLINTLLHHLNEDVILLNQNVTEILLYCIMNSTGEMAALTTAFLWSFTSIFFTLAGRLIGSYWVNKFRMPLAAPFWDWPTLTCITA